MSRDHSPVSGEWVSAEKPLVKPPVKTLYSCEPLTCLNTPLRSTRSTRLGSFVCKSKIYILKIAHSAARKPSIEWSLIRATSQPRSEGPTLVERVVTSLETTLVRRQSGLPLTTDRRVIAGRHTDSAPRWGMWKPGERASLVFDAGVRHPFDADDLRAHRTVEAQGSPFIDASIHMTGDEGITRSWPGRSSRVGVRGALQ